VGISVVIPARNEEHWLPSCLESLGRQRRTPDEVIVVDNGSTDRTAEVARAYGCTVLTESMPGVGRARRAGCNAAQSDIVAITDADTHVPEDWTATILRTFEDRPDCVALTGPWVLFDGTSVARSWTNFHGLVTRRIMTVLLPSTINIVGCNGAFRKEAYERIGGFRADMNRGEDINLSLRLRSVGRVSYIPSLIVQTSGRRFRKSFLAGISQYLPDAARQVSSYLVGKRETPQPAYEAMSLGAGLAGWSLSGAGMPSGASMIDETHQRAKGTPALVGSAVAYRWSGIDYDWDREYYH
jgi:glycosyltransferase involved in cell wall biosynthesis